MKTSPQVEFLKASLRVSGSSFAAIAKEVGLSRSGVSRAVRSRSHTSRCNIAIAEKLGVDVADLWSFHQGGGHDLSKR
ncbi:helix-turn-helix domain-containing protein [Paracoccus caeni]|uniref:Helix-turn-helix domain-containing protein n=1 Tax=Paracoccus caeni TaxID=657651 RepID=A0A934SJA3_9RHOB|nr:helix-turn-helix domain-containing protein [Paracoccus caeni]